MGIVLKTNRNFYILDKELELECQYLYLLILDIKILNVDLYTQI